MAGTEQMTGNNCSARLPLSDPTSLRTIAPEKVALTNTLKKGAIWTVRDLGRSWHATA